MTWTAQDISDQTDRTFLVTGANSGLGYVTALELARHHGHVIMVVRNEAKGREALASIGAAVPGASLQLLVADMADLDSVKRLAAGLRDHTIDVLVNNAGIMMPPRSLSPQGHESQFATNHLGHFALTGLLLDQITDRIVTVSSDLHRSGSIHWDDLTGAKKYSPAGFYSQSKFANVLFGLELDRRLRAAGSAVRSIITHPGYAATNLQTTGPTGMMKVLGRITNRVFAQPVQKGAWSQLYAAVSPEALSGQYIGPKGRSGFPTVQDPVAAATSPESAKRLWELSEDLTSVHYHLPVTA
ncbi:oxidoreductase [Micromonospora sp. ATCC 39149]|uniref:SDR family NAD(P)-dependent oxidoreductase n=1 Tax=Micromonospora carbonacea TaxID=47853 RepID=A0A7D5YFU1_9ACTN|nr:oxidoreductase [Micromonospora sp. ATCC 39149]QLK00574.1 SDR family NAD(P)-dependent oxidoreductase [Micromonospora carbonacea]